MTELEQLRAENQQLHRANAKLLVTLADKESAIEALLSANEQLHRLAVGGASQQSRPALVNVHLMN